MDRHAFAWYGSSFQEPAIDVAPEAPAEPATQGMQHLPTLEAIERNAWTRGMHGGHAPTCCDGPATSRANTYSGNRDRLKAGQYRGGRGHDPGRGETSPPPLLMV